jgi:hypothetical protein
VAERRLVKLLSVDRYWAPNSNLSARGGVVVRSYCDRLSSEAKAEDVRKRSLKMQKEYLIKVSDAVNRHKISSRPGKVESTSQHRGHGRGLRKLLGTAGGCALPKSHHWRLRWARRPELSAGHQRRLHEGAFGKTSSPVTRRFSC